MNDFLKWCLKVMINGVIWVFVLSITWNGQSLFLRANELLVQNSLVEAVDEELADLWQRVSKTAHLTFSDVTGDDDKAM